MTDLQKQIQAILFWKNEPLSAKEISKILGVDILHVVSAAKELQIALAQSGVVLVMENDEMRLAAGPETSAVINELEKQERSKDLSKAALETLAIVLYKGPIRRSEIDYIRGVNSQFIVRHLEIRGLIEKEQSDSDARVFLYKPTLDLIAHLGLKSREELPEFENLVEKLIEATEASANTEEKREE